MASALQESSQTQSSSAMQTTDPTTEALDSLLRGELSAIETYSHVIHKFPESTAAASLQGIRSEHLHSVETLRSLILGNGGDPSTDSGAWGGFAGAVEALAALFGDNSAIAMLRQGEEHGINQYNKALEDPEVSPAAKEAIRNGLLPALHGHLKTLAAAQP
jgi:demethoxyubiquinone hydroxylase (CLK1/Coq7/Cat5 family)